ncbi:unnamed protein product [Allacma fusca]|uniref:C2H2-type domain-containing protein n=1 Tax=Allacma fusca TaxID=39272 RepID=A0A8J2JR21_9HEXA|nr:unnamed protein product [Allacma fusca]
MDKDIQPNFQADVVLITGISDQTQPNTAKEYVIEELNTELGYTNTAIDTSGNQDMIIGQCLVCYRKVDFTPHKSPLDQFNDLLQIFRISMASFKGMQKSDEVLPSQLFCATCTEDILTAMDILVRIESLQNDLKIVTKFLQQKLLGNQDFSTDGTDNTKWISKTRRVLTQCFSSCEVPIKPEKDVARHIQRKLRKPRSTPTRKIKKALNKHGDLFSEGVLKPEDNASADVDVSPSVSEEETEINNYLSYSDSQIKETCGKSQNGTDGLNQNGIILKIKPKKKLAKLLNSPMETNSPRSVAPASSYRTYKDGKVISLDCPYCKKKLTREDFCLKSGEYIFKCPFPECCDRIMTNFIHVVRHHESLCPSMPQALYSGKRKRKRLHLKKALADGSEISHPWGKGFIHNEYKEVVAFECPQCQIKMSYSDFQTESGVFIFKCPWVSCSKTTKCFSNLCIHHRAHCVNGYSVGRIESLNKKPRISRISSKELSNEELGSNKGLEFPKAGPLVSFECFRCEKKLTYSEFLNVDTSAYIFKCPPTCCDKVFSSFPNLAKHHEAQCRRRPIDVPDTDVNIPSDHISTELKPLVGPEPSNNNANIAGPLNSFECNYCHKEYRREDVQQNCSGTISYKCDLLNCDKAFPTFIILQNHHESTCPKRPEDAFACNLCDKKFKSSGNMRSHMISFHTHKYEFYCEICGAGCVTKSTFYAHMRTHVNHRKFKCQHCPASFKKKDHLQNHETRLHTTDLPFMCGTCGRRFKVRQGLRQHEQNVHSLDGPSICKLCNKTFASAAYVQTHIRTTHMKMRDQSKKNQSVEPGDTDGHDNGNKRKKKDVVDSGRKRKKKVNVDSGSNSSKRKKKDNDDGDSSRKKKVNDASGSKPRKKAIKVALFKKKSPMKPEKSPQRDVDVVVDGVFTDDMG